MTNAVNDEMYDLLFDSQWIGERYDRWGYHEYYCPWCGNTGEEGHASDCKLDILLKKVQNDE